MTASFMDGLDPGSADALRGAGPERSYPARSYLFHEGDRSSSVLLVESGLLRVDRTSSATGRVVLLELAPGCSLVGDFGVIDEAPRSPTASTVTTSTVRHIPAPVFRDLLRDAPAIQGAVLARLTDRLRALSNQFYETSILDAPARIAARLLRLVDIEQSLGRCTPLPNGEIDLRLPINQEELGQWSGLSREGATKGLKTLRSIGLIDTGRMRVRILDVAGLSRQATAS